MCDGQDRLERASETSERILWIDPVQGMAGDMLAAALVGLGAPQQALARVMREAGEALGLVLDVHTHLEFTPDDVMAYRLHTLALGEERPLAIAEARAYLELSLAQAGVNGCYAEFAFRALDILRRAEADIAIDRFAAGESPQQVSLTVIGWARTPYQHEAPYQPATAAEGVNDAFYIEMAPGFEAGLASIETFAYLFVISYLDRSRGYEMALIPPWQDRREVRGLFATRSPNRPSPIGLTRAQVRRVSGNRIYTGPLDLFDGTPILDIKPFIQSLDGGVGESGAGRGKVAGNDGWLEGSEHLELHRRGIPHTHPQDEQLHTLWAFLLQVTGVAWGLQKLDINISKVNCLSPVRVGGRRGSLDVGWEAAGLSPATKTILEQYRIPYELGQGSEELLAPAGAAILAALEPRFIERGERELDGMRCGVGLGHGPADPAYELRVCIREP